MINHTFIIGLFVARINLDAMSDYLNMMESYSKLSLNDFEKRLKEEFDKRDLSETDNVTREEILLSRKQGFLQHLLANFVVSWYSFVEQEMMHICESLDLKMAVGIRDSASFGKGVFRVRKFLKDSGRYEIKSGMWNELVGVNRLRNFIVHQGLEIDGKYDKPDTDVVTRTFKDGRVLHFQIEKDFMDYLTNRNLIEESHSTYMIIPSFEYCRGLVKFSHELFYDLYWGLDPLNRDD